MAQQARPKLRGQRDDWRVQAMILSVVVLDVSVRRLEVYLLSSPYKTCSTTEVGAGAAGDLVGCGRLVEEERYTKLAASDFVTKA